MNQIEKLKKESNNLQLKFNLEGDKKNTKFDENFIPNNKNYKEKINPISDSININSLKENVINKLFRIINI